MNQHSPKLCIIVVILFAASIDLAQQAFTLYEGSQCLLHTGINGVCKNALKCNWLIENLHWNRMTLHDIRRCSFSVGESQPGRYDDIVCCGDKQEIQPLEAKPKPCQEGFIFDFNCSQEASGMTENYVSGSKLMDACKRYTELATPFRPPMTIIKGKTAYIQEIPHMAALGYRNRDRTGFDFDCGASLIAEQWVVSAAHCVRERRKPVIVRFGMVNLYSEYEISIDRSISHIYRHNYSSISKKNDIALIKFFGTIEFSENVRPACMHLDSDDVPETEDLLIAGWGSIEPDRTNRSEALLKAYVQTVPLEQCNQTLVENNLADLVSLRGLSRTQMCASNLAEGSDACYGDSGGPIFQRFESGLSVIVGIVSFGVSCGTELPGVYTRIASYADWIESIVWPPKPSESDF